MRKKLRAQGAGLRKDKSQKSKTKLLCDLVLNTLCTLWLMDINMKNVKQSLNEFL